MARYINSNFPQIFSEDAYVYVYATIITRNTVVVLMEYKFYQLNFCKVNSFIIIHSLLDSRRLYVSHVFCKISFEYCEVS